MSDSNPEVLDSATQVTPGWMTRVLQNSGVDAVVSDVAVAPVGTGQMADSSRITLTYESTSGDAPDSVVGKFPSTDPQSRSAGERGGYGNEINFYREVAPLVAGRTPRSYYAEVGKPDEFTLILEDMAPAEQGDQIAGCTVEQAEAALVNLAGFHGPLWNSEALKQPAFGAASDGSLLAEFMAAFTPEFVSRYADRLSEDDKAMCTDFAARVLDWNNLDTGSNSVVHGDYRLDNLLFGTTDSCPPVTTVDWQTLRGAHPHCATPGTSLARVSTLRFGRSTNGNSSRPTTRRSSATASATTTSSSAGTTTDSVRYKARSSRFSVLSG